MQTLIKSIETLKGCKIANIQYVAEEKLPKYVGLGKVEKKVSTNVQINYSYENAVNNRLEKNGLARTFKTESLPWGTWEVVNKIIAHKGEKYLRTYSIKGEIPQIEYFVNGVPATPQEVATIKAYLASKSASAKQSANGLSDNQVTPRNVKFSNILYLKCGNILYNKSTNAAA